MRGGSGQKGLPSRSHPESEVVPSRFAMCFVLQCFGPIQVPRWVGAIPARPGPILLPSVPYRIGPGRAETDFLATSDLGDFWGTDFEGFWAVSYVFVRGVGGGPLRLIFGAGLFVLWLAGWPGKHVQSLVVENFQQF